MHRSESIRAYQKLYPYIKPYRWRMVLALCVTLPVGLLDGACAWALKPYMDVILLADSQGLSFFFPLLLAAAIILQGVLNYVSNYLNIWVGQKIAIDLKQSLLKKLLYCDTAFFDRSTSGDIIFRYHNDADMACSGLLTHIRFSIIRTTSSLALIGVLFYNSAILASVALAVLLIAVYPLTTIRKKLKEAFEKSIVASSTLLTRFSEVSNGNRVISTYNLQEQTIGQMNTVMQSCFKVNVDAAQRTASVSIFMHAIVALGIAATLWLQGYLIATDRLTPGNFVSFIAALIMLYTPVKGLGNNAAAISLAAMALERVFEKMEAEPLIHSKPDAVEVDSFRTAIRYDKVFFSYLPGQPVLQGIDLEIKRGQKVAFVGHSGGGKTTLTSLLPRLYDVTSGKITLDGVDIRDIALSSLRNLMSIVLQDSFLFSGTILDNITLGKEGASREEAMEAARAACLEEFITSLPLGLDTEIGERGILLSGGQKQRVAIARAFIRNSPIVILDEATSSLDNTSEAMVQQAIENLMHDRTILIIAHRLTTVIHADIIMVMSEGNIVESGTHAELFANESGIYRSLYENQFV